MRYLVQSHIQVISDASLLVWTPKLRAILNKNNARERSANADALISKT